MSLVVCLFKALRKNSYYVWYMYFQSIFNGDYICISPFNKYPFFSPAPPFINPLNKNPQMADTYISAGKNAVFYCDTVSVQGEKQPSPPIWKKNGKDIGANRGQ